MEEYTEFLKEYLNGRRDINKKVYMLVGTINRGVNKGRFTLEQAEKQLFEKR